MWIAPTDLRGPGTPDTTQHDLTAKKYLCEHRRIDEIRSDVARLSANCVTAIELTASRVRPDFRQLGL